MMWSVAAALALAGAAEAPSPPPAERPIAFAQLTVREQIIIRVPVRSLQPAAPRIEWKEGKGPKCLAVKSLVGARLTGPNSVDLLLRDQSRVRAKLQKNCPALDYYIGIYIRPNADGRICADRDTIRSRVGGACEIERFRSLKPVSKD